MNSILTSIKKLLGITEECEHFDTDIIIHINSVFLVLTQIGIGPAEGFSISDKYATWDKFLSNNQTNLEAVKTYVYLRVRLLFDPPSSSAVAESINRTISEYEWRLNLAAETSKTDGEEEIQNGTKSTLPSWY